MGVYINGQTGKPMDLDELYIYGIITKQEYINLTLGEDMKETVKQKDQVPSQKKMGDPVNHPDHYCTRSMEVIDIIELIIEIEENPKVAYNMSNVLKYLMRFRDKGKAVEDLKKAQWYLNRMIEKVEEE